MATQYTAGITQGQVWTAAIANQIGAAWESFTPTTTQGVAITQSVNYSKYLQIQKLVIYSFNILLQSAGTAGAGVTLALPITAASLQRNLSASQFYDASAATTYINVSYQVSATSIGFINSASGGSAFGAAPAVTVANGDYIFGTIIYEAA